MRLQLAASCEALRKQLERANGRARSAEVKRPSESPMKRVTAAAAISLLILFLALTSTRAAGSATLRCQQAPTFRRGLTRMLPVRLFHSMPEYIQCSLSFR